MIRHRLVPQVALGPDIPEQAREWRNNYAVRRWCRQYSLLSESNHAEWLSKIAYDETIKMFSIIVEDRPVGVCGLTSIDRVNQKAEFSLYIAPGEQRKGYGRKALTLLLLHGFEQQNLNRIWGESFDGNPAQKMFESLGMTHEGRLGDAYFRDGEFISASIWAITRKEFNEFYRNRLSDCHERGSGRNEPDDAWRKPDDSKPADGAAVTTGDLAAYEKAVGELAYNYHRVKALAGSLGIRSRNGGTGTAPEGG